MPLPDPIPGLVVRYRYLWHRERNSAEEGRKDRPCAVVLAMPTDRRVIVLPITHLLPRDPSGAIEIPLRVKRHLGLDNERSWIVLDEFNIFVWPGYDLRPVPSKPFRVDYGVLPPAFFIRVRDQFLALYKERRVRAVPRT